MASAVTQAPAGDGHKPVVRRASIKRLPAPPPLDLLGYHRFVLRGGGDRDVLAELIVMQEHPHGCEGLLDERLMDTIWTIAGRISEEHDGLWSVPLESVL